MDVLAILSCAPRDARLHPLIGAESLAALRFGGTLRLVDFWLSALRAADMLRCGIVPGLPCRDLINHLFSAAVQGFRFFFLPQPRQPQAVFSPSALQKNRDLIFGEPFAHILLISCSTVCFPDLRALRALHMQSSADATLLYAPEPAYIESGISLRLGAAGTVEAITHEHICQSDRFLGCMLLRREVFSSLLECEDAYSELLDALAARLTSLRVCALPYHGYYATPRTPGAYLRANLELPALRSASFADMRVGAGSTMQNCLLLPGATIGNGCRLEYVICAEGTCVPDGIEIRGQPQHPFILCKT